MSTRSTDNTQQRFVQVIEEHRGLIYKVAHAYCYDGVEREDLVQEIILQLWKGYGRYDSTYKLTTWMYRIALNVAITHYRKHEVRTRHRVTGGEDQWVHVGAEEPAETDERVLMLRVFVQQLRKLDKSLMLLYLDEKSHGEIAEILDISVSNVGTRISRLKKQLKTYFNKIQP
ncbi:RNA polymerase sigma factor [Roseivirga sp. BDSF3-8]|uniref:RNA polymerase sigma factor n=1 Tax=Roseivirga sp. BDSF3-8 TaxID=3241598 RepID=UPI0035321E9A